VAISHLKPKIIRGAIMSQHCGSSTDEPGCMD